MSTITLHAPARRVERIPTSLRNGSTIPSTLTPADRQQPLSIAEQLSGYAACLQSIDTDDLAAERLSADALAEELAARDVDEELAEDLERRALGGSCRLGAGIFPRPSARGAIRAMAFA
jgi:hypothetical protein